MDIEEKQRLKNMERDKMLISHKLQEKSRLEVQLADFHHGQKVREHEATKQVCSIKLN